MTSSFVRGTEPFPSATETTGTDGVVLSSEATG